MDMEFVSELRVFFLCGVCGIVCGIVYDMIRIVRRIVSPGAVGILLLDVLFWILCAFITFGVLFFVNYGRIRWYEWIGIAMGAGAYFLSASPLVTDGGTVFLMLIIKLVKILISPILYIVKVLKLLFGSIKGKISEKIAKNRLTTERFWFRIKKRMMFYCKYLKK